MRRADELRVDYIDFYIKYSCVICKATVVESTGHLATVHRKCSFVSTYTTCTVVAVHIDRSLVEHTVSSKIS